MVASAGPRRSVFQIGNAVSPAQFASMASCLAQKRSYVVSLYVYQFYSAALVECSVAPDSTTETASDSAAPAAAEATPGSVPRYSSIC